MVSPRTFPVLVRNGVASVANPLPPRLCALNAGRRRPSGRGPDGMVRLARQTSQRLIDVERRAGCDVADFREPMHSREERNLILDPGEF